MTARDLGAVARVAGAVHPAHPEGEEVFAERLRLWPDGCFVLGDAGTTSGYVISHPWRFGEPPALDTWLGALPAEPSTYYIHDLAILPDMRGGGSASWMVERLVAQAQAGGSPSLSLVAVNKSTPFWERHGFCVVGGDTLREKLASYGAGACFMVRSLAS
jgi:ribosomal protein S18 acetylase RimI-like enzyme